jgi:hypothetical protein
MLDDLGAVGFDPQGDLFGDYRFLDEDADVESDDSDIESDIDDTPWLEPCRSHVADSTEHDIAPEPSSSEAPDGNHVLCGACTVAESVLEREPFVVRYPTRSGVWQDPTVTRRATDETALSEPGENVSYQADLMQGEEGANVYTPFTSQLEWDIAKWAEL